MNAMELDPNPVTLILHDGCADIAFIGLLDFLPDKR